MQGNSYSTSKSADIRKTRLFLVKLEAAPQQERLRDLVDGEGWIEVLEAAQGRSADGCGKFHQGTPLLDTELLHHLCNMQHEPSVVRPCGVELMHLALLTE